MKIIYIIIENFNRELIGKLFLSIKLINFYKNYKIIIGEKNQLRKYLKKAPPGIIIEKGMRKGMIKNLKDFKKKKHRIFLIDEEAITYFNDKFYFKRNIDNEINNHVDFFLATSNRHKKTLAKKVEERKIIVIGNLRYDIDKKNYEKIYKDIIHEIEMKYGKFILINSRFGNVNRNSIYQKKFDKLYFQSSLKIFKKFLKLPEKISKLYPKMNIILRPHPSESTSKWIKKYEKKNNIFIIYKDNVIPWILSCKKIYQNRCTTALDAFFLSKKIINYDPYKNEFEHKKLFSILEKKKNSLKLKEKKIIKNYVNNFFTHDASSKLIQIIKKIEIDKIKSLSFNYFLILIKFYNFVQNIKNFIKPNDQDYKNYTKQKMGEKDKFFVKNIFNKMQQQYLRNQNLNIKFCSSDIFLIEKKI